MASEIIAQLRTKLLRAHGRAEPREVRVEMSLVRLKPSRFRCFAMSDKFCESKPGVTPTKMCAASADTDDDIRAAIAATPFLAPSDPRFMHGRAYSGPTTKPRTLWRSSDKPRDDHDAPSWLTATEFEDVPEVLTHKVKQFASAAPSSSKRTVLYTGAGISASVIGQAARSGTNTVGWEKNKMAAPPTPTHHALVRLHALGLVHAGSSRIMTACRKRPASRKS